MNDGQHPFDILKARSRHQRVKFIRDIKSEVARLDNDEIMVITRLLDEHHDMSVVMLVGADLVIHDIACKMERMPYPVCPETESAYEGIKGLMIFQRGIIREIRARVKRTAGCTHFTELIEASLRALFAGLYSVKRDEELAAVITNEQKRQMNLRRPVLTDSCRSFRGADRNDDIYDVAVDKIRELGRDPEKMDPLRGI